MMDEFHSDEIKQLAIQKNTLKKQIPIELAKTSKACISKLIHLLKKRPNNPRMVRIMKSYCLSVLLIV